MMKLGEGFADSVIAGSPNDDETCWVCGRQGCTSARCAATDFLERESWAGLIDSAGDRCEEVVAA